MENGNDTTMELALKRLRIVDFVSRGIVNSAPPALLEGSRRKDGSLHIKDIIQLKDVEKFLKAFVEIVKDVSMEDCEGLADTILSIVYRNPGDIGIPSEGGES